MHAVALRLQLIGALALAGGCDPAPGPQADETETRALRDTERDFGDYVVYVNALTTDELNPDIAAEYGIVRSTNRALLTVSVHKKQPGSVTAAVPSDVSSTAVNLSGQLKNVLLRQIREEDAIYYIGELAINNGETLIYSIEATPDGEAEPLSLRYQKQFVLND